MTRRELVFLAKFLGLLALFFALLAPKAVNDRVVEPFTAGVAHAAAAVLRVVGEPAVVTGTAIASPRFSVNIKNGCNGLETILIFSAALLAFPAPAKTKAIGLLAGFVAIEIVNLVRIVSLFFIGIHFPKLFEDWHLVVWQVLVVLFGVGLFLVWADRLVLAKRAPEPSS